MRNQTSTEKTALLERGFELAEAILTVHGAELKSSGKHASCRVPWRDDKKPSLDILRDADGNTPRGSWIDRGRNEGGDVFDLVARLEGLDIKSDFREILKRSNELLGIPSDFAEPTQQKAPQRVSVSVTSNQALDDFAEQYGLRWADFEKAGCRVELTRFGDSKESIPAVVYTFETCKVGDGMKKKSLARFLDKGIANPPDGKRLCISKGGTGLFPKGQRGGEGLIVLTGGEEKALTLIECGCRAVSWSHGETNAHNAASMLQYEEEVVVFMDADEAGKLATSKTCRALQKVGVSKVRFVHWPNDSRDKRDATNVFREEGADALRAMVEGASIWEETKDETPWWMLSFRFGNYTILSNETGALQRIGDNREIRATTSEGVVRIAEERRSKDTVELVLQVRCRNQLFNVSIPAGNWGSDASLRKALCETIPALTVSGRDGCDILREASRLIRESHPPKKITVLDSGLSPDLKRYIIPGAEITSGEEGMLQEFIEGKSLPPWGLLSQGEECTSGLGNDGRQPLQLPSSIETLREISQAWLEEWPLLLGTRAEAAVSLAVALLGPVLPECLGGPPRFVLGFVGMTGSGKTTCARLLAMLWGSEQSTGQHSTWKGALHLCSEHRHALAVVDDLREGMNLSELVSLLFDGGSRGALQRNGKLREIDKPEGAVLLTAESLDGGGESTRNRILEICFEKRAQEDLLDIKRGADRLRSLGVRSSCLTSFFIAFLLSVPKKELLEMQAELYKITSQVGDGSARAGDLAVRSVLAVNVMRRGFEMLLGEEFCQWIPAVEDLCRFIIDRQVQAEEHGKPEANFLAALQDAVGSSGRFVTCEAVLTGSSTGELRGPLPSASAGQVRLWRLVEEKTREVSLLIPPRETLAALGMVQHEGRIRDALSAGGYLSRVGENKRKTFRPRLKGNDKEEHRPSGWLLRWEQ